MARVCALSPSQSFLCVKTKHSLSPLSYSSVSCSRDRVRRQFGSIRAETMATEKLGIKIEKNPPESKLTQLGIRKWPKWGCPPSKFPWTYDTKETCYLLEGKVKVTPDGASESVEIGAGDLVEFPKGMSCTWDVSVGVDKHYNMG
ncbi:hypothetical protein I3843_03G009900 [Carya illinoinensis]|uniref:(S)-ureidoglycine aminohydrolase cupin domain-containing protein n=2 Tax=Carya illinoinensis TaxID=32201 RepID=A0A922JW76_CARIL|nr:uncharacterized protein LOC122302312 [Carya illinoinensis]KAG6719439.1 hypothetical protein I3842_03G005500 [Carya illinoinensis]KAG7985147.1 hypothetical protein I3843_03G009900 [Carya illinoinensis]